MCGRSTPWPSSDFMWALIGRMSDSCTVYQICSLGVVLAQRRMQRRSLRYDIGVVDKVRTPEPVGDDASAVLQFPAITYVWNK